MTATGVRSNHIHMVWPDLWGLIKPAVKLDTGPILSRLLALEAQAWMVYDDDRPIAGIVSRLVREGTSGGLLCHLWLIGGSRLSEWSGDFIPKISAWAREEGCVAITGNGRPGWSRIVARFGGYRIADSQGFPCWRLDLQ